MAANATKIRERVAWAVVTVLAAAVAVLGMNLVRALKSPTPAEWNSYSAAANELLYERLNPARPEPQGVVAHQGGIPPADEADPGPIGRLSRSYARGLRLLELDFSWTADGELVVAHDWNDLPRVPTRAEFLAADARRATLDMVYAWLEDHRDAFIVTDCKKRSLECAARIRMERPDLVPQFIVQIYALRDHELVRGQGFRNVILTLYRTLADEPAPRIVDFVAGHELFALTIPRSRAGDEALVAGVRQLGVPVYVHTINDPAEAARLRDRGATGVYSDALAGIDPTEATGPLRPRPPGRP